MACVVLSWLIWLCDWLLAVAGVCPVLCSSNGVYVRGACHCYPGWKGKECSIPHDQCEVSNCNGNGDCIQGECRCQQGFKGADCSQGGRCFIIGDICTTIELVMKMYGQVLKICGNVLCKMYKHNYSKYKIMHSKYVFVYLKYMY